MRRGCVHASFVSAGRRHSPVRDAVSATQLVRRIDRRRRSRAASLFPLHVTQRQVASARAAVRWARRPSRAAVGGKRRAAPLLEDALWQWPSRLAPHRAADDADEHTVATRRESGSCDAAMTVVLLGASCTPGRIISVGAGNGFRLRPSRGCDVRCSATERRGSARTRNERHARASRASVALGERAVALSVGRSAPRVRPHEGWSRVSARRRPLAGGAQSSRAHWSTPTSRCRACATRPSA